MGTKANRLKMRTEDRAKQFAPFAALKGFEEAIHSKEYVISDHITLDEEKKEKLDYYINMVEKGDIVRLVHFNGCEQIVINGMVSRIDITAKIIKVVNTKIDFDDIYDIEILKKDDSLKEY